MKKIFKILTLVLLILILSSLCFCVKADNEVEEQNLISTNNSNNSENKDTFLLQSTITLSGKYSGNVFALGQNVIITEGTKIDGDLFVIAADLNATGLTASQNVFFIGRTANFSKSYVNKLFYISSDCTFNSSYISNDIYSINQNLKVLNSSTSYGSVYTLVENLTVDESSSINGNLTYFSAQKGNINEESVKGLIKFEQSEQEQKSFSTLFFGYVMSLISSLILVFVVSLILTKFAPKFTDFVIKMAKENKVSRIFGCLGIGLISPIVLLLISLLLLFTRVGVSLSLLTLSFASILFILGTPIAEIYIAHLFARNKGTKVYYISLLLTTIVVWGLSIIPVCGFIIGFLVSLFGIGLILYYYFKSNVIESNSSEDSKVKEKSK